MKKIIILSMMSLLFSSCHLFHSSSEASISLSGSRWEYTDEDWTYQIEFQENGILKSNHPNDQTPDNDAWSQSGIQVHFEFNDGYSKYSGKLKDRKTIVGHGESSSGKWKFTMTKID